MPSRRMIDPAIWQSETFSELTWFERVLFIGLFSNADDQGRMKAHAALIRSQVFPFDDIPLAQIEDALQRFQDQGSILVYENDGKGYLQFVNWWKYQHLRWAHPSIYPPPPDWTDRWCYWDGYRPVFKNWPHGLRPNWWKKLRRRVMRRDYWTCRYCGAPATEVDHIVPRCQGGGDEPDNLAAACAECNRIKAGRTPTQASMELSNAPMA